MYQLVPICSHRQINYIILRHQIRSLPLLDSPPDGCTGSGASRVKEKEEIMFLCTAVVAGYSGYYVYPYFQYSGHSLSTGP